MTNLFKYTKKEKSWISRVLFGAEKRHDFANVNLKMKMVEQRSNGEHPTGYPGMATNRQHFLG